MNWRWHAPPGAVAAAVLTPISLGLAPIFGKMAIMDGADPFSVAAVRTVIAAGLLWLLFAIFARKYLYIYPAGLLGCIVVGVVNGIGSLFFYSGLGLLDASLVQLLNGTYVVFAVMLARVGGEPVDARTIARVGLALAGIILIAGLGSAPVNWLGVGLMLGCAILFAGTLVLSQYVMYEMPAQTASVYILTVMAVVVLVAWLAAGTPMSSTVASAALWPVLLLGITTAASRLLMFASVQIFGSLRTVIIAILEVGVTLILAYFVLGERLTAAQWVGVALMGGSLLLVRSSDLKPRNLSFTSLIVRDVASVQFQRIAFHRAFGTEEHDNEFGVMAQLTTAEMQMIQRMMGAGDKPVNPFPLPRNTYLDPDELNRLLDSNPPSKE
ncbi:MAG: DMT family transporter [Anaerolineae bacterium]|nr:DMT family transporter [Anaerolineae bacterium]